MHGQTHAAAQLPQHEDWRHCEALAWGIDLFNHGFYWEAHESWEQLWLAFGRQGPLADVTKGLIKLAAACVKAREGRPAGVASHSSRSMELIANVRATTGTALGLDLEQVFELAANINRQAEALVDQSEEPVVIVAPGIVTLV